MALHTTATFLVDDQDTDRERNIISENLVGRLVYTRTQRRVTNVRIPSLDGQFSVARTASNGSRREINRNWVPGILCEVDGRLFNVEDVQVNYTNSETLALFFLANGRNLPPEEDE